MTDRKPASLLAAERYTLKSRATGKDYEISIALPYAYAEEPVGGGPFYQRLEAWPAVYLTDANWHFGMVAEFVREMAWCGRTQDAIVVGIGYPEAATAQETWRTTSQLRSEDLTPVRIPQEEAFAKEWIKRDVRTGGAPAFFSFLKQELIPWVEQQYRADSAARILAGHSYGGLFALWVMLQEPALFRGYLAASPYLVDPERLILKMEREFAESHRDLKAQLYLAIGELEESSQDTTLTDMLRLAALLESRHYDGLAMVKQIVADTNHCEAAAPALHGGLKTLLRK